MENRGPRADQCRRRQHAGVIRREGQGHDADQREAHARAERIRLRMLVGINTDDGLQEGCASLIGQRDGADLHETQVKFPLEQGINRHDQRLHHVVEEVREAQERPAN